MVKRLICVDSGEYGFVVCDLVACLSVARAARVMPEVGLWSPADGPSAVVRAWPEGFVLTRPAVCFGDDCYDVADLVLLALAEGSWQQMEDRLARGLALEAEHGRGVAAGRVSGELNRFRYERRLISGKELRDWLVARSLVLEDLRRHCLRALLLAEHGVVGERAALVEVLGELRAEALCSGVLRSAARRLVDLAAMAAGVQAAAASQDEVAVLSAEAAAHAVGLSELEPMDVERRARVVLGLVAAEAVFVAQVATPEGLRGCLAEHGVAWLRVECSELTLPSEGAAREAMLCLRLDGTPLAELCEQLGVRTRSRVHYLDDLGDGSAPLLISAALGEPVGPFASQDGWRVLVVEARVPPTTDDPELVRRATAALVHSARERLKAGRARELTAL